MLTMTREQEQQYDSVRPQPQPLEAIVRRFTDDGRLIVGFLVSTMCGDMADVTPSHQLQAARMLIKLGFSDAQLPDDINSNAPARVDLGEPKPRGNARRSRLDAELARFARDETDGGRDAIRFLVDVMQGNVPDFKPCHRLAAARELLRRGFDRLGGPDAQPEQGAEVQPDTQTEHATEPQPEPEVPEGFKIYPDGSIGIDVLSSGHPVLPTERLLKLFGWKHYSNSLREQKAKGKTILKPNWWREGLEEFVDEDAPTLVEAILEAAEAQGITVPPHLLEATRLKNAPMPQADSHEEAELELKADPEEDAVPEEEPEPEPIVADEDTNVPWSKPGYFYRDELSAHGLKVLEKGGTLHWDTIERRFP